TRVLMVADIKPRPAVEGVLPHARDIIGHEVVAEIVALVGRAPGRAVRLHRKADAIADARGEQLLVLAVRIERQHRGAVGLRAPRRAERLLRAPGLQPAGRRAQPLRDVAGGADRHQHPLAVRREDNVAGRMAVAGRKFRNDGLRLTGGVQIASTIGKAHDAVGVSDIDPLRVVAARKKRNPERRAKTAGNISLVAGFAAPSAARRTRIRPARVSATKISPLGATRMMRGPLRPSANNSILKPGGACGAASAGRATTRDMFAAAAVAPG